MGQDIDRAEFKCWDLSSHKEKIMKNLNTIRKLALAMALIAVAGCATPNFHTPVSQEEEDRSACHRQIRGNVIFGRLFKGAEMSECMAILKHNRQVRLENKRIKEERQKEVRRRNALDREWQAEKQRVAAEALKKKCGNDYNRIRIGMTFTRLKTCWPKFRDHQLTSQISRTDGILSIYEVRPVLFDICSRLWGHCTVYVLNKQIVGWQ